MASEIDNPHQTTKRRRVGQPEAPARAPGGAAIFAPFRTLGLVSPTAVPFTYTPLGKTTFQITTSVGRCLHTYDLTRGLQLLFVTRPQTPGIITATVAWKGKVFAAWGGEGGDSKQAECRVWVYQRGKRIAELEAPTKRRETISKLLVFGSWIVGCGSTVIDVWKSNSYEHYTTIHASQDDSAGSRLSGHVCNMPTLLNKICVGKQDGSVEIWNVSTAKLLYTILPPSLAAGSVTALAPAPALGLLAIARADGSVALTDIRADKELLTLNKKRSQHDYITSISFRTDDLGAGSDGREAGVMATASAKSGDVTLWDLNNGGRVMGVLWNAHDPPSEQGNVSGGITRVEFLPGQATMVTTGHDNALKTWAFDETPFSPVPRPLHCRNGHAGPITRLDFLPVEADDADAAGKWLLSAGRDHGLWGWSLRRDAQSTELSQGNVRKKHKKLGNGAFSGDLLDNKVGLEDLKAPEITCMASCMNRDGGMGASTGGGVVWANQADAPTKKRDPDAPATGWESIVTGHRGDRYARTWFWGRRKAGRWVLETSDRTEVRSVAMSPCGTFALVGSAEGAIDMFNLQSGIHRQRFPSPLTPAQAKKLKAQRVNGHAELETSERQKFSSGLGKHTKAVTGLAVDNVNQTVISASLDGKVKMWDFRTGVLQHELDWHPMTSITALRYHRPSELVALSCDDTSIRVVDVSTRRLVRELWGGVGQITDHCFSNDGRLIVAASIDSVIRVWDLPTGHLIDAMRADGVCTALAFSRTGEFLATAHANSIGISLWSNRALFTHVSTRQISEADVREAAQPTASGEGGQGQLEAAFEDAAEAASGDEDDDTAAAAAHSIDQLTQGLTTLSLVPRNRWQTLLHLDTIAARNRPIEPPKAPAQAPFFLGSIDKLKSQQAQLQQDSAATNDQPPERVSALQRRAAASGEQDAFSRLLRASVHDVEPFFAHLKALAPAAADLEIRSLRPASRAEIDGAEPDSKAGSDPDDAEMDGAGDSSSAEEQSELVLFVRALAARLRQRRDYEVVQAWMAVFLRVHGDVAAHDPLLRAALADWRTVQQDEARRLGALVGYCGGVVSFLRSVR